MDMKCIVTNLFKVVVSFQPVNHVLGYTFAACHRQSAVSSKNARYDTRLRSITNNNDAKPQNDSA